MHEPTSLRIDALPVVADLWAGDGAAVVLLHAGVGDRRSWRSAAEKLAERRRVVTYDRRGFGDSPVPSGSFRHVDDLFKLLDNLPSVGPAHLVGSSMGGQIALDAAVLRPEAVKSLVLFAPAISGAPEPDELDPQTQRLIELMQAAGAAADVQELNRLETWMWLDGPGGPEGRVNGEARELVLVMNEIILRNDVSDAADTAGIEAWHQLEKITIPVTVAWGALEVPFVKQQCKQLVERLPNARGQELPGVAHLPYLEAPTMVADIIDAAAS